MHMYIFLFFSYSLFNMYLIYGFIFVWILIWVSTLFTKFNAQSMLDVSGSRAWPKVGTIPMPSGVNLVLGQCIGGPTTTSRVASYQEDGRPIIFHFEVYFYVLMCRCCGVLIALVIHYWCLWQLPDSVWRGFDPSGRTLESLLPFIIKMENTI